MLWINKARSVIKDPEQLVWLLLNTITWHCVINSVNYTIKLRTGGPRLVSISFIWISLTVQKSRRRNRNALNNFLSSQESMSIQSVRKRLLQMQWRPLVVQERGLRLKMQRGKDIPLRPEKPRFARPNLNIGTHALRIQLPFLILFRYFCCGIRSSTIATPYPWESNSTRMYNSICG